MPDATKSPCSGTALRVEGLSKSFGGVAAVDGVSAEFAPGSITAIIGPNGAGKTTFFNLVTGALRADKGEIWLDGRRLAAINPARLARLGVARAFQIAQIFPKLTVRQSLETTLMVRARRHLSPFKAFPDAACMAECEAMLNWFELDEVADQESRNLPHGARKRLDLAIAVSQSPRVLLLDEPGAGMGHEGRSQMTRLIRELSRRQGTTIVLVEHDMDLVFDLAERILVLNFGKLLADGTPAQIRSDPKVIEAYLGEETH